MKLFDVIIRFFIRYIKWIIIIPIIVTILVIFFTRNMTKYYKTNTIVYTGFTSDYNLEAPSSNSPVDYFATNNATDNLIGVIKSRATLEEVGIRLFAQCMVYGNPTKDNEYITARKYRYLQEIVPDNIKKVIDKRSVERTYNNLVKQKKEERNNFIYGLVNYYTPYFSLHALQGIDVKKKGNSDMLEISYKTDDPSIAYQTLIIHKEVYSKKYGELQYSAVDDVIEYYKRALAKAYQTLLDAEEDLLQYSLENRVINYPEQSKYIADQNEKVELLYQEVLMRHNSSKAALAQLERNMAHRASLVRENTDFINQMRELSRLHTSIARKETFIPDSLQKTDENLQRFRDEEKILQQNIMQTASNIDDYQSTKEGVKVDDILTQWLNELLTYEKSKAELDVMVKSRENIDNLYSTYSPVGTYVRQKERRVTIAEEAYINQLHHLNIAMLKRQSIKISSATLKVLAEPIYPIMNEPTKRKIIIIMSGLAALLLVLFYFALVEIIDRTLRDAYRTERLTKLKVIGVLPDLNDSKHRKMQKRQKKADKEEKLGHTPKDEDTNNTESSGSSAKNSDILRELDNSSMQLARYILKDIKPWKQLIVNVMSCQSNEGKQFAIKNLQNAFKRIDMSVNTLLAGEDFQPNDKEYLMATTLDGFANYDPHADICIVEHPTLKDFYPPAALLSGDALNILVCRADRAWERSDRLMVDELKRLSENEVVIVLNRADWIEMEDFGAVYTTNPVTHRLRNIFMRLGFTAKA